MPDLNDEELAKKVQNGDTESFGLLMGRYEPKLLRYARKFIGQQENIEDIIQEVFIKAYTNIKSFDTKRKFSSWLYRIAHNELVNALKKKDRNPIMYFDLDTLWPQPVAQEKTDQEIDRQEVKAQIELCLNHMDVKYREMLILFYLEELGYKEISEILHISSSVVGVRLKRAREKMKKICVQHSYDSV